MRHSVNRWLFQIAIILVSSWVEADTPVIQPKLSIDSPDVRSSESRPPSGFSDVARISISPAHYDSASISIDTSVDDQATVGMEKTSNWVFLAGGVAAVPLSVLNPFFGLGVLYPFIGPPMNASFKAKRETFVHVFTSEPLPVDIVEALKSQLGTTQIAAPAKINLRIGRYGLVTRSGESTNVMNSSDADLCLMANAILTIGQSKQKEQQVMLNVGFTGSGADLAAPICASVDKFSRDDGIYLRQSIRELAELLAAMVLNHMGTQP